MRKIFVLVMLFFLPAVTGGVTNGTSIKVKEKNIPIWKVILAEAASEGEPGMKAVFCVMRNRAKNERISIEKAFNKYCVAAKRKDLDSFVSKQGDRWIKIAKKVAQGDFNDVTKGATHFENIEEFSVPYWVEKGRMIITVKIKNHTFFKET